MPTIANSNIPTPKSWGEFESIALDALKIKWESPNLTKNGRQGQRQNGVDIYGEGHLSKNTGVQSKNYKSNLTKKMILKEIAKAEKFSPPLDEYYFVTSKPSDAKLQEIMRLISRERISKKKFPVGIFFWDDLISELANNPAIFQKHYPQIGLINTQKNNSNRYLSLLELGYYGMSLNHYTDVVFSESGQLANQDPKGIEVFCSMILTAGLHLYNDVDYTVLKNEVNDYLKYLNPIINGIGSGKVDGRVARRIGDRISQYIENIEQSIVQKELAIFRVGKILSCWEEYEFEKVKELPFSITHINKLKKLVYHVNGNKYPDSFNILIDSYLKDCAPTKFAHIATDIHSIVRGMLIDINIYGDSEVNTKKINKVRRKKLLQLKKLKKPRKNK